MGSLTAVAAAAVAVASAAWAQTDPGRDALRAFNARASACPREDIQARLELAELAEAWRLPERAERIYRDVLLRDPGREDAFRALWKLAETQDLPRDSKALARVRQLLPSFRQYETRRYVVVSDADPHWTQLQIEHLERAHHQFQRFTSRVGLRPLPLRHKLVCVLFKSREEFVSFGRSHDTLRDPWIFGYYALRHDRIVFFNAEAEEGADEFATMRSIGTTIHEAIHQLLYHTHVQNKHVQYPVWLCEGLATAFETDAPNAAFGPEYEYAPRRTRFEELVRRERLMPLRELVQVDHLLHAQPTEILAIYTQSYAFVAWIDRFCRTELRDYLELLRREPPGRPTPARQLEVFELAFGDVQHLERRWRRHEESRLTPHAHTDPTRPGRAESIEIAASLDQGAVDQGAGLVRAFGRRRMTTGCREATR